MEHRKLTVDQVLELKMADEGKAEQGELLNGIKVRCGSFLEKNI